MTVIEGFKLAIEKWCSIALLCIAIMANGCAAATAAQGLVKDENGTLTMAIDIGTVRINPDVQRLLSEQYTSMLIDTVTEVASLVREHFPQFTDQLTITIRTTQQDLDHVGGVIGIAQSPESVDIDIAASFSEELAAPIQQSLKVTLLHELHHIERGWTIENNRFGPGIMIAAVNEGLAIVFAEQVSGIKQPHLSYPDSVDKWVEEILALPVNAPYETWMMGTHPDGRQYIGYRTGKFIVEQALRSGGETIESLTEKGNYEILFQTGLIDTNPLALSKVGDDFATSNQPGKAIQAYTKAVSYAEPALQTKIEQRIDLLTHPVTLSDTEMNELAGQYHSDRMDIKVSRDKSGLYVQLPGKPKFTLYPTDKTHFVILEADVSFEFVMDEHDAVATLLFNTPGGTHRFTPIVPAM
ncbi:DUF2268 domain-containing protein [Aestuariibacter halophilus]|uniref:DUF2268 domain-containing protein n=1 Tax=Fluctibacter halophilus TaxID=226011 RepID=A0ABS8G8B0_9ALTE|nr:DUF2268 domain-containing putative Zn-dependent protease [Aestuariibacter halophilus]MCC2616814.1 DUF2268 domain-containing protein [Aestuariibacter halophilus]